MWFRRQYNLPPTDPRFLDATVEDIVTDYWAHHYDSGKGDEIEDDDFDIEQVVEQMAKDDWEEVLL